MRLYIREAVVVCFLLLGIGCVNPQMEPIQTAGNIPEPRLYFAQITDIHAGEADHLDRLRSVVRDINRFPCPLEFVVVTGDFFSDTITNATLCKQTLSVLSGLRPRIYYAAGNHDGEESESGKDWSLFDQYFNPIRQTMDCKGLLLVFPNLQPFADNPASLEESNASLEWLASTLESFPGQPSMIFNHIPSSEDFYANEFHDAWPEPLNQKWIDLINRHNVKAVISGHFHRDELHWLGRVPLYVCPSVAGNWGRQASYRMYEYTDGKLSYMTQYVEPWPHARKGFSGATASTEGDWNIATAAIDGNSSTRWESRHQSDPEWLVVTLDQPREISSVYIDWETASAKVYDVQISSDGENWTTVASVTDGLPDEDRTIEFASVETRHLRILGRERATQWGYSIWELSVP